MEQNQEGEQDYQQEIGYQIIHLRKNLVQFVASDFSFLSQETAGREEILSWVISFFLARVT